MSELKFKRIIAVSSQDDVFKAENLIHGKKWIGSKEVNTKQTVIIELENASQIRQLEIENESSASIEVQACKESDEDFTCILSPVSFMSLSESRNKLNKNRLKVFTDEANLVQDTLDTKWNRIQIICTQPFNPSVQFGISSLKVYSKSMLSDDMKDAAKINTGIFSLKKDLLSSETSQPSNSASKTEPSLTKIGSLFEKYKNNSYTKEEESSSKPKEETKIQLKREEAKDDEDTKTTAAAVAATSTPSSKKPNLFARADETKSETKKESKPTVDKKQILKGVIFALSGFQNPERSNIRDKGLRLGAKYRPDWADDCTHLICAFSNTPKAQVVRQAGGKIVTKDWLDECEEEGKIIDWEEFKVESKSDSEDEDKPRKAAKTAKKLIRKLKRKDDLDDSHDEEAENSEDKDFIASSDDEEDMDITELTSEQSFDSDDSEATASKKKSKSKKRKNSKKDKKHKKKKTKKQSSSSSSSSSSSDSESDIEAHKKKKSKSKKNIKVDNQTKNDKKVNKENLPSLKKKEIAYEDDDEDTKKNELKKSSSNKTEANSDSDMDAKASWELPDFFEGKNFFLYGSFDAEKRKLIERSIIGFAGNLENYMNNKIDYVITNKDWNNDFKQSKNDNKNVLFLKHEWIIACAKKQRLQPYESYEIKPN